MTPEEAFLFLVHKDNLSAFYNTKSISDDELSLDIQLVSKVEYVRNLLSASNAYLEQVFKNPTLSLAQFLETYFETHPYEHAGAITSLLIASIDDIDFTYFATETVSNFSYGISAINHELYTALTPFIRHYLSNQTLAAPQDNCIENHLLHCIAKENEMRTSDFLSMHAMYTNILAFLQTKTPNQ